MIVNGMNKNPKGMSKEEKVGLALGAVAFIVVLLFFLVLGNMSDVKVELTAPEGATAPAAPSSAEVPVTVIEQQAQSLGMGNMLMMVGGVVLLIGFWVVANRFGLLSIEAYEEAFDASGEVPTRGHDATVPAPLTDIYQQLKSLTLDLAHKELIIEKLTLDLASRDELLAGLKKELVGQGAKVSELTRELERRHQTVQRLSEGRRQQGVQLQALHSLLGCDAGDSLVEKVEQREIELAAALTTKKELSLTVTRLSEHSLFKEVKAEELSKFWLTVKLDGKPFMSKRRQDRLLSRMKVEKMAIVQK